MATIGKDIQAAKNLLQVGEIVAIPTETVYGLAANALDEKAVVKIFEAKNRPFFDPLIVHVSSIAEAETWVEEIPDVLRKLLITFSPGPLTVLLKKKSVIPDIVTSGLDTVGIRIPNHPLTLELLSVLPFPLCAPSANPFGYVSPTKASHVQDQLGDKIPYILDGGNCAVGLESTIVGIEEDEVCIYRLGGLSIEDIEQVIGKVCLKLNQSSNPKAPGMLASHYAPRKPLLVGDIVTLANKNLDKKLGLISLSETYDNIPFIERKTLSPTRNLSEAACQLFAALRYFDHIGIELILAEYFPTEGIGRAMNDRLKRASSQSKFYN